MASTLMRTAFADWPVKRGKVRDIYDLGETLILVSTDRISAFDWVMPNGIPDKGRVLTQVSNHWFDHVDQPHHLLARSLAEMPLERGKFAPAEWDALEGRTILVKKTQVVPVECVVRGYLAGSGWSEYQATGSVCGIALPSGLRESEKLPQPIFTPATKAEEGHDENISFDEMVALVGAPLAEELRKRSLEIYVRCAALAAEQGILVADTKFEWGQRDGQILLIDEVLTPDSSRFWPADAYAPGRAQVSFDKQFARDWLTQSGWDKCSPPPELPEEIVSKTRAKYIEAYERLTGNAFPWS